MAAGGPDSFGMTLSALRVRELRIPFKVSFRHAAAERSQTSSVWVEAVGTDGSIGYGESCPRTYVTAETPATAAEFIATHEADLVRSVTDVPSLRAWMHGHREGIDRHPAAWCAVELALLDLIGRTRSVTVDALLELPPVAGSFRFSAVLGDSAAEVFAAQATQYRDQGFTDFKIKLSGDGSRDRAKVEQLRRWNLPALRVRADANNLWRNAEDAIVFLRDLEFPFFALEEPVAANDYRALAEISDALSCAIVLDESLLRAEQIERLAVSAGRAPERWFANVRVSKMGGLLRSLDVVAAARAAGLGIIVGAQVGETSVLTRAALSVAQAAGPALVAQEGAFGTHLLQWDVCDPPLMFGRAGVFDSASFGFATATGFGLRPRIEETIRQEETPGAPRA
jgi:L-alanine-DL-glutamate epimerase-like enolase superfamily enzyme